jgi:hypothetical protein
MGNIREIEIHAKESDEQFAKNEGKFFTTEGMKIFNEDVDIYAINHEDDVKAGKPRRKLLAKYRKAVLPLDVVQVGWDAFRLLAIPSRNRGAAAGPVDLKGIYWKRRKPVETTGWSTRYMQDGKISKMRVNNVVASGVIGYYEKTPFLGQPCRMTGYTRRGLKHFYHGIPFLEAIDEQFKELVPDAHKIQLEAVSKKPLYQIANTAFSTLTVNMNFRTALHKDAGDFERGFGNLSVIEWGKYHGGETLFPRFGIGFNLRTGDFIAMDVHEWHTNAPIVETKEDARFNKSLPDIRTREARTGVIGSQERYQRLSFVCYFREKIEECSQKHTHEYYQAIDFNLKEETEKAKASEISVLPIPGITGTLEEARRVAETFKGVKYRETRKRFGKEIRKATISFNTKRKTHRRNKEILR